MQLISPLFSGGPSPSEFYGIFIQFTVSVFQIITFSIYTLSDLGVLSNLIGSLSLANEHYSPPTE